MTSVLSWNIQNGLGIDGELSLERIARQINAMGDPDIICLQEVSINTLLLNGSYDDQVAQISNFFKGFTPFFGAAINRLEPHNNKRALYGNLILSRYPVHSVFYHALPQPVDSRIRQMPRQMTELTVQTPARLLRVMTTHLEFHSHTQRVAQVQHISNLNDEIAALGALPPRSDANGPYEKFERSTSNLVCGDFNFLTGSPEYDILTDETRNKNALFDAWKIANSDMPHAPTCGVFDTDQWPEGPHCRDFFFVSKDLKSRVRDMTVDIETDASDHQPLLITLDV